MNNIKQLEKEIERAEAALFEAKTIKDWDAAVHRYNELKIKWNQMAGERISHETFNYSLYITPRLITP